MNKIELNNILDGLRSIYGADKFPKLTEFAMDMWFESMKDLDYKQTKVAIANYIKVGKFPPTIADIREQYRLILNETQDLNNSIEDIFSEMQSYYPGGFNDKAARGTFFTKLLMIETEGKLKYAEGIKNKVIDYVKNCERTTGELTMTLSECIKWAVEQ